MLDLFAAGPVVPAPEQEPLWTMPSGNAEIVKEIESINAQIKTAPDRVHICMLETRRRQCEDALAVALLPKGYKPPYCYCGIAQFEALQKRCDKLGLEPDWLTIKIAEHENETPQKFAITTHYFVGNLIEELERSDRRVKSEKRREIKKTAERHLFDYPGPCPPVGMKAVEQKDGTYTHVTHADYGSDSWGRESAQLKEHMLRVWAGQMGLNSDAYEKVWSDLAPKLSPSRLLKSDWSLVQTRLAMVARQLHAEGVKKLAEEEKKAGPINLFCAPLKTKIDPEVTAALSVPTGHVSEAPKPLNTSSDALSTAEAATTQKESAPTSAEAVATTTTKPGYLIPEEEWLEIRKELGITDGFVIDTKEKADWVAGKMQVAALELAYIINRYKEIKPTLERRFLAIQERFEERLEEFSKQPGVMPAGKKTLNLLYGSIGYRNKPESLAMDDTEHADPEGALQSWIHQLSDGTKNRIGVKSIPRYSRDLVALKSYVLTEIHAERMKDAPPGMVYTPAKENEFFVGPSLDSLKRHIKEGKLK